MDQDPTMGYQQYTRQSAGLPDTESNLLRCSVCKCCIWYLHRTETSTYNLEYPDILYNIAEACILQPDLVQYCP
jgi:hypothetical protein